MSTAIEPAYATALPAPQGGALPTSLEWQALERMATMLAGSDVIPYRLKRKPADIAVILLAAREYGIPPLMALSKLPVVNGTPAPMGELMVALVLRAGHRITAKVYNPDGTPYRSGRLERETYAECRTRRAGEDEDDVLEFTIGEALDAQLIDRLDGDGRAVKLDDKGKPTPWQLYTANMLRWRAVANACRLRFPDVLLGLSYLPEELGAVVDAEGAPIVGELVDDAPAAPPRRVDPGTQDAREATDLVARAVTLGDPEQLRNGLAWAERNGVLDLMVKVPPAAAERMDLVELVNGEVRVLPISVREAFARLIAHAEDGNGPVVVDEADATVDAPAESAPQEPPAAAQGAEQSEPAAEDPPAGESPQEATYDVDPGNPDHVAAIQRAAAAALATDDVDTVRNTYRAAGEAGRAVDVAGVLEQDDRDALGIEPDVELVAFGALLMAVAAYITRHGAAVRSALAGVVEDTLPVEDPPGDVWPEQDPAAAYPI